MGALHLRQREWRAPATGAQQARRACSAGLAEGVGQGPGQGSGQVGAGSHAGEAAVQLLIRRVSSGSADGESGWGRKGAAVRRGISPTAALTTAGEAFVYGFGCIYGSVGVVELIHIRRVSSGSADVWSGWGMKVVAVRRGVLPTTALMATGESSQKMSRLVCRVCRGNCQQRR